ncbi:MAG: 16S rRNA processing protein RimM [Desulfuromonadaceae bacterium GWC2_58_13]|nr:MAG: 16S rRNA processing protein RimM [Desulfuromonadaceae bacterium GWC2_58_13]
MKEEREQLFQLGVVVGTHGLRGDLKVRPLTPDSDSLLAAGQVVFRDKGGRLQSYEPARAVPQKGNVLLRLRGLETIEAARHLVGNDVLIPFADLPDLDDDEFYWYELQGLKVVDRTRGELGTLDELLVTGAHDIYVVNGRFGEIMVPAVSRFVIEVDLESGQMTVDLPEGLVPEVDDV